MGGGNLLELSIAMLMNRTPFRGKSNKIKGDLRKKNDSFRLGPPERCVFSTKLRCGRFASVSEVKLKQARARAGISRGPCKSSYTTFDFLCPTVLKT